MSESRGFFKRGSLILRSLSFRKRPSSSKADNGNVNQDKLSEISSDNYEKEKFCGSPDSGIDVVDVFQEADEFRSNLYEDVLCVILHSFEVQNQTPAFDFIKKAFGASATKHEEVFEKAKGRNVSEFDFLNVSKRNTLRNTLRLIDVEAYSPSLPEIDFNSHQIFIKTLSLYEIEKKLPKSWTGQFGSQASNILSAHAKFCHLDEDQAVIARFVTFVSLQKSNSLDFQAFTEILDKLIVAQEVTSVSGKQKLQNVTCKLVPKIKPVKALVPVRFVAKKKFKTQTSTSEEKVYKLKTEDADMNEKFWLAAKELQDPILKFVSELNDDGEKCHDKVQILKKIFLVIGRIGELGNHKFNTNFQKSMTTAISDGARLFITKAIDHDKLIGCNDSEQLTELIRIVVATIYNFDTFSKHFSALLDANGFPSAERVYSIYEKKISEVVQPLVLEISNSRGSTKSQNHQTIARDLIQLGMQLKLFASKGVELFSDKEFEVVTYDKWYKGGIDQWCKVHASKELLSRIDKAIEIDNLQPLDKDSSHSSSAIDVLTVLYNIKQFWESVKLSTPENIAEIANLVVSSSLIYLYNIVERVLKAQTMKSSGNFKIPPEVCLVANNINFVVKGVEKMIKELTTNNQKIISDLFDHGSSRMDKLLSSSVKAFTPKLEKLLLESVGNSSDENNSVDSFINELLSSVHEDLDESAFESFKLILWESILNILSNAVKANVKIQREKRFFLDLRTVFQDLQRNFMNGNENIGIEKLFDRTQQLDFVMELHGMKTSDLIHQYYKDRYQKQQKINTQTNVLGSMSIVCYFDKNVLRLEVLNAKHLISSDVKKLPSSFVKIKFISKQDFPTFPKCKTATQAETKFPLYDEKFEFELKPELRSLKDAIIRFSIKDKHKFSNNHCIAEAFLSFADIQEKPETSPQLHLPLTKFDAAADYESLRTIQLRSGHGDKSAKEFLGRS